MMITIQLDRRYQGAGISGYRHQPTGKRDHRSIYLTSHFGQTVKVTVIISLFGLSWSRIINVI